ncbi:MAG: TFIIB-type zinc ribbon-containing protein [Minisyncoccales bacterium]
MMRKEFCYLKIEKLVIKMSVEAKERLRDNNASIVQNNYYNIGDDTDIEGPNRIRKCPECSSKCLVKDYKKAEIFCADCGMVIAENIIDLGPEWRAFDPEQTLKKTRVGAPMTYRIHDKGLGTVINWGSPSKEQYKLKKLHKLTYITKTTEKSFIFALSEIDRMACALKLHVNIIERASMLYRKAMKKHLIRGRSIEALTTALLYIVCRQYGVPRTLDEITEFSRVRKKEIRRAYFFLLRELDLKVSPASPVDFVPRFCSLLNLGGDIRAKAIEIIKKAAETELTNGRGPIGIAAAAIYIAAILSGEHQSQSEIAKVCGTTPATIRTRYKEMTVLLEEDTLPFLCSDGRVCRVLKENSEQKNILDKKQKI